MREILFRGKRIDNGEWVEGSLIYLDEGCTYIVPMHPYASSLSVGDIVKLTMQAVIPESIGQYTGLKDKNGTKIFEGDICRNTKTGEIVSVCWLGTMGGYVWSRREENTKLSTFGDLFRVFDKFEIIGNIHDNPELLKEVTNDR